MRRAVIGGWTASLLLIVTTVGAVAQSPEPAADGPPWFGGRVEMADHGFAVTVPEGWVGMNSDGDMPPQWQAIDDTWGAASVWDPDSMTLSSPLSILAGPGTRPAWQYCSLAPQDDDADYSGSALALAFAQGAGVEPDSAELESRSVDLAAGQTTVHDVSLYDQIHMATYVIGQEEGLSMVCSSLGRRPGDDWLSIAQTIERLPVEESPATPLSGTAGFEIEISGGASATAYPLDGRVLAGQEYELDAPDPRATGTLTVVNAVEDDWVGEDWHLVARKAARLEAADGSWVGQGRGLLVLEEDKRTPKQRRRGRPGPLMVGAELYELTGRGSYEGLTLFVVVSGRGTPRRGMEETAWGLIVPTAIVPAPVGLPPGWD